jgi:hypothetical protein
MDAGRRLVATVLSLLVASLAGGAVDASAATTTLTPVADSYVDASVPAANYGTQPKIRTDGSPVVRSYLRFNVSGWVAGSSHATLRLNPTSSLGTGLQVSPVANTTWVETSITSANAPPPGAAVATTPPPTAGTPVAVDVTAAIAGNGLVSLALSSTNSTAVALASRESGAATSPQLVIDTTAPADSAPPAPTLATPSDGAQLNTGTPAFTGVAGTASGDQATVAVLLWSGASTTGPPQLTLPAAALAGGSYSVTPGSPLADGLYTALVEQRDAAGNVGRSAARSLTIDTQSPAPALSAPAAGSTTTDTTPGFAGTGGTTTGDGGSVSVLAWRGTDTSAAPVLDLTAARDPATGAFALDSPTALADGLYTVRVRQTDAAGNAGMSATRTFTVDTVAPAPVLSAPAAGSTTADPTPTFSGTGAIAAGDAGSVSVLAWHGTDTSGAPAVSLTATRDPLNGAFSVDAPTALADGLYTVRVEQTDAAGLTGRSAGQTFTIDAHAPPPPATVTLTPVADSYVDASLASTNYGTNAKLRTDGSPVVRSYLRFDVQGWAPGASRATLRLMPTSNLLTGLQVVRVADTTWGERTITASNAPPLGPLVATTVPPKTGTWLSVDVTSAIAANGLATFGLASSDTTAEALASRESGAGSPQLVIDHPDTAAPIPSLTAPANGALLDTSSPTFTGVAGTAPGDAATVDVAIWADVDTDETPFMTVPAVALAGGEFSASPSAPLPDDVYTVRVEQRDAAGNVGHSAEHTITLDTHGPSPSLDSPADGESTSDSKPSFAGHGGANAGDADTVQVELWQGTDTSVDPLATIDAPRGGDGAFTVEAPADLPDGRYTARARQADAAGHSGMSAAHAFTVDTAAPEPVLSEPADASTTVDPTPSFGGTAGTASGDSGEVSIDLWDGTDTSADPVVSFTAPVDATTGAFNAEAPDALDGGSYTARARQRDAAGNVGTSAAVTFVVDGPDVTAPRPVFTQPPDGSSTSDASPTLAGKAGRRPGDGDSVTVRVWSGDDTAVVPVAELTVPLGTDGTFSVDVPGPLTDGGYTARAEQTDAAGNHGTSAARRFTVDTAAPAPTLTNPANASSTNDPKPAFEGAAGTATGDADAVSVLVWHGSSATGDPAFTVTADPAAGGSFSVVAPDPLTPGTYTARAEQEDAAGNRGESAPVTFTFLGLPDPTIAAAGDISCAPGTNGPCQQMATSNLLVNRNPDAVLALGDLQYESGQLTAFTAAFDPSWGRVKAKIHPALGNHEYGNSQNAGCDVVTAGDPRSAACGYFDYFNGKGNMDGQAGRRGEGYYAFDVGQWRLYSMNSNCSRAAGGVPGCGAGSAQEQWLRADLAAHPRQCQLMYMHHPMFTSDTRAFDTPQYRGVIRPLWDAFYQAGGDVVLAGHSHFYERFAPQTPLGAPDQDHGIQQIIAGTGGRNMYTWDVNGIEPNSVVRSFASFGILDMKLHPASYEFQFVPIAGGVFTDSGTRSCHGPPGP